MSLARLTQLFAEGTELVLTPPDGSPPFPLWIAKLNSFEEEQANQEGRVTRARLINALKEVGSPEYDVIKAQSTGTLSVAMVKAIASSRESELFVRAVNDMRSDPEWRERLEILDFTDDPTTLPDMERKAHAKLQAEYNEALLTLHTELVKDLEHDLSQMQRVDLEEHFLNAFITEQGIAAFGVERSRQHIYFCMRSCEAAVPDNGRWDHSKCDHQVRFLASVAEVDQLPQSIRDQVEQAYTSVTLSPSLARFTDALASSSESPEPSVKVADSAPSGPAATSAVPDTI